MGTGKAWNEEIGFETSVPLSFSRYYVLENDNIRFEGRSGMGGNPSSGPAFAMILLLSNEQPDWIGKTDRLEFKLFYELHNWTSEAHPEGCVEMLKKDAGEVVNYILSWGNGRGVLVIGAKSAASEVDKMATDLKLAPGACEWR